MLVLAILDLLIIIPDAERGRQGRVKLVKHADGGRIHHIVQVLLAVRVCLCLVGLVAVVVPVYLPVLLIEAVSR